MNTGQTSSAGYASMSSQANPAPPNPLCAMPSPMNAQRRATTTNESAIEHLTNDTLGPEGERPLQCAVAAIGAVIVDARRIDDTDPTQQNQAVGVALHHCGRVGPLCRDTAIHRHTDRIDVDERQGCLIRRVAGVDHERRGRPVAQTQARARPPSAHLSRARRRL